MKAINIFLKAFGEQFWQWKYQTSGGNVNAIKTIFEHLIEKYIQTKPAMTRRSHPWIRRQEEQWEEKKKRAHSKAKRTNNSTDWENYKDWKPTLKIRHEKLIESTSKMLSAAILQKILSDLHNHKK